MNCIYNEKDDSYYADSPGVTVTRLNSSGKVLEADILINTYLPFSNGGASNTYDTWTVFIHEAGHVLGLDHSWVADSVMYVSDIGTVKRYPSLDDEQGIYSIYH